MRLPPEVLDVGVAGDHRAETSERASPIQRREELLPYVPLVERIGERGHEAVVTPPLAPGDVVEVLGVARLGLLVILAMLVPVLSLEPVDDLA